VEGGTPASHGRSGRRNRQSAHALTERPGTGARARGRPTSVGSTFGGTCAQTRSFHRLRFDAQFAPFTCTRPPCPRARPPPVPARRTITLYGSQHHATPARSRAQYEAPRKKTAPHSCTAVQRVPPLLLCPARIRQRESPSTQTGGANSAKRRWSAESRCPCISRGWWRPSSADATQVRSLICPPTQDHETKHSQPWPWSVLLSTNSTTSRENSRARRSRSAAPGAISRRACVSLRTPRGARTSIRARARHASPFNGRSRGYGRRARCCSSSNSQ
jgi:hypothetical protein